MTPIKYERPFIFHYRPWIPNKGRVVQAGDKLTAVYDLVPSGKGGVTLVYDPLTKVWGISVCNKHDNFDRKRGVAIATGRKGVVARGRGCRFVFLDIAHRSVESVVASSWELAKSFAKSHNLRLFNRRYDCDSAPPSPPASGEYKAVCSCEECHAD